MKKAKKALLLALCALLLVGASIMGTLAYLTDTESVTNTFTVGKVGITLSNVELNSYKLIPGTTYATNPKITVDADSEKCWLVIKLVNNLGDVVTINDMTGWTAVEGKPGYYIYNTAVAAGTAVDVFASVTCDSDNTNATLDAVKGKTIEITAYAIQEENVTQANVITYLSQHYTLN